MAVLPGQDVEWPHRRSGALRRARSEIASPGAGSRDCDKPPVPRKQGLIAVRPRIGYVLLCRSIP